MPVNNSTSRLPIQKACVLYKNHGIYGVIVTISKEEYDSMLKRKIPKVVSDFNMSRCTLVNIAHLVEEEVDNVYQNIIDRMLPEGIYNIPYKLDFKTRDYSLFKTYSGLILELKKTIDLLKLTLC